MLNSIKYSVFEFVYLMIGTLLAYNMFIEFVSFLGLFG